MALTKVGKEGITGISNSSNANAITIDSSENVGIGTTSPTYQATVFGSSQSTVEIESGSDTGESRLYFTDPSATGIGAVEYHHNGNTMRFTVNNTERMRLLSGGGLKCNGDTAAANALDDYEEGTFTPTIAGTSTAGTATYARQAGVYTKIGRQVFYAIDIIYSSGTGTGNLKIAGLPFASSSSSMIKNSTISAYTIALAANNYPIVGISLNTTDIFVSQLPVGGGSVSSVPYDAAGQIVVTGHYFV